MNELIVDNFAGGGGASTGIEYALGRSPDIAINHDPEAIRMHKVNHPNTKHYCENIWDVDPVEVCKGRPVGFAWFSPDCKHFSKAKGGKPVDKNIRGLAWVVLRWAGLVRPRVIGLENVEEFETWGPIRRNRPIKSRKGETYRNWRRQLEDLGYEIETKVLNAADYGAPTKRKRYVMIARCDGSPIKWPTKMYGPRNSAQVIDGKLKPYVPAASIIDWDIEGKSIFDRSKPLAENTMKRIARGIQKFVLEDAQPFIMQLGHTGFVKDRNHSLEDPLSTIVTKNEHCLITPYLIQYNTESGNKEVRGQSVREPLNTITTQPRYGLITAFISQYFAGGYKGAGSHLDDPLPTVTAWDHNALCTVTLEPKQTEDKSEQVRGFLIKYYGQSNAQSLNEPLDTVTTKDRFGLVTVHGVDYQIVDIKLRMLQPKELYQAMGFPITYIFDRDIKGEPISKKEQIYRCGNAVCPPLAAAVVAVNAGELSAVEIDGYIETKQLTLFN